MTSKRYTSSGPAVPHIARMTKDVPKRAPPTQPTKPHVEVSLAFERVRAALLPDATEKRRLGNFRALMLDLETSPNLVWAWGLFDQDVSLSQLVKPSETLCFAAKFYGDDDIFFYSRWEHGEKKMVRAAHELLSEADAIITQNGDRFDLPILNRDFLKHGLGPPSPAKSVDLLKTSRAKFKFASNKLDHITQELGLGSKMAHEGFPLWTKVLDGDADAQARMREYNIQDVLLLEPLFRKYRPWISGHPNVAAFLGTAEPSCPVCNSTDLQADGYVLMATRLRARYRCNSCGAWNRERTDKDALPRAQVR